MPKRNLRTREELIVTLALRKISYICSLCFWNKKQMVGLQDIDN